MRDTRVSSPTFWESTPFQKLGRFEWSPQLLTFDHELMMSLLDPPWKGMNLISFWGRFAPNCGVQIAQISVPFQISIVVCRYQNQVSLCVKQLPCVGLPAPGCDAPLGLDPPRAPVAMSLWAQIVKSVIGVPVWSQWVLWFQNGQHQV